jgi:xanthosine utilization system XapX-like protein
LSSKSLYNLQDYKFGKMVIKSKENFVGAWVFLTGVILAVIIGIWTTFFIPISKITQYSSPIYAILVILGIIVGAKINVSGRGDSQTFLISSAVLVIVSKFGMESVSGSLIGIGIGDLVSSVFGALLVLFVPATIVVALKTVFSITTV